MLTDLTFSAFAWTDLSDLDQTILWTERLLIKSGRGMATPELMEVDNDDNVVDIINCVALYYVKDTISMSYTARKQLTENGLMETNSKAVESLWDRQITSIYPTPKIQDLKYRSKNVPMRGRKNKQNRKKVTVANCDVENLEHQN